MRKNRLMLASILLLGIGYATVTTTLDIAGDVKIATNNADFDVRITKATLEGSAATISEDGKTVTFKTSSLSTVGNKTTLDFEVENNSEMYDAEVSLVCTAGEEKKDYFQIPQNVTQIAGKRTGQGQLAIELIKDKATATEDVFVCTLNATAKERTSKAEVPPIYYAFGDPLTLTDRTTDYTTLTYPTNSDKSGAGQQAKVFAKLDADGVQKSVCIIRNGSLECFKNNNWEEEKIHIIEVFSDIKCDTSDSSHVRCDASDFYCLVNSYGNVGCSDDAANFYCDLSYNSVICG